jgi:gliding motility-associated-like protein
MIQGNIPYRTFFLPMRAVRRIAIFLSLALALYGGPELYAQANPPAVQCAEILPNGDVLITWEPSAAADEYTLWRRNSPAQDFVIRQSNIPVGQTTFIDNNSSAANNRVDYYLTASLGGSESATSDTISTIYLELEALEDGLIADLQWNTVFPPSAGIDGVFIIERNIDAQGWIDIGINLSAFETAFLDTLYGLCVDENNPIPIDVAYRVRFQGVGSTCFSRSEIRVDEFKDDAPPEYPFMETMSFNPFSNEIELSWTNPTDPDFALVLVQELPIFPDETVVNTVDVVEFDDVPNDFFAFDEPSFGGPTYMQLISFDRCENDKSRERVYSNMWLDVEYQNCDQFATVKWNPYDGWVEGVENYNLIVETDGAPADTMPIDFNEEGLEFPVTPNSEYCMYIEAVSNGPQRASTSNLVCFIANYPRIPDFVYLNSVSALSDQSIQVDLFHDPAAEGMTYELWRARGDGDFFPIASQGQNQTEILSFIDNDVDASIIQYTYKVKVYDGCENERPETNIGKNIVATAGAGGGELINTIQWTDYADWEEGVAEYQLYRKLDNENDFTLLATFGPQTFDTTDDAEPYFSTAGEFCYRIDAIEEENQYGNSAVSRSNVDCATQAPILWIPNTIKINAVNPVNEIFKPQGGFIDFESYKMEVLNKWGEELFATEDFEEGWDGTYRGNAVPEDYYQFIITYRDGSGKVFIEQGPLYVLRGL